MNIIIIGSKGFIGSYIYSEFTKICTCHNCGYTLHYRPLVHNVYSGGPFYCGNCDVNVTEDIYGKTKEKKNKLEKA